MDGLNFKLSGDIIGNFFSIDAHGSFIPKASNLPMEFIAEKFRRQLNSRTGFYRRLAEVYERADVQSTDNPLGNTPVIGVGYKKFGKRPLSVKRGERLNRLEGRSPNLEKQLLKREAKIEQNQIDLINLHKSLEPDLKTDQERLLWEVESDQVMTGGGFDNNKVGEVHKSALHFISDSEAPIEYEDTARSKYVVEACLRVRDALISAGLKVGSLKPVGASYVRAMQDNDGMFGYPVYASGYDELTNDIATRLLIETGVDTRPLVGTMVNDATTKVSRKFAIIDAGAYILDNKVFTFNDLVSIVTLLVRIQKHGWKKSADGKLVAKDGKTRSVYPNSFVQAIIEGMIIQPFNEALQNLKVSIMPSLQDKPTRVEMLKTQIINALNKGYDYLAADWSKWDASVKGSILATVFQLVIKPFINANYYYWIDAATVILTYKAIILDSSLCSVNSEELAEARKFGAWTEVRNYYLVGLTNGLISGAKATHTGGSLYGEVVIHHAIPLELGWEPILGAQAGDDTLMGVPLDRIDLSSVEKTYGPIVEAAEGYGLHSNASKQIWHNSNGEVVKVFLQDSYHAATDTWGIGSIFRPVSAVWFSERDKNLSIAEQLMAEISRMNQGADNPFAHQVVEWWLSQERYLGWLFKTYGVSGFERIVESIGSDLESIAKRIDVGSFSFGISRDDLKAGNLPILNVMADVTSHMSFSSEDRASFLEDLNPESAGNEDDLSPADLVD